MKRLLDSYWAVPLLELLAVLSSDETGLSADEAKRRLTVYEVNSFKLRMKTDALTLLINQFNSPLIITLLLAAGLSSFYTKRLMQ